MSFSAERVFDRVLVVMFENQYRSYLLDNPFFRRLARQGIQLGNYNGVMHPSQTNYIAAIAGELCGVSQDDPPRPLLARTGRRLTPAQWAGNHQASSRGASTVTEMGLASRGLSWAR
jgi:hypothetical protein